MSQDTVTMIAEGVSAGLMLFAIRLWHLLRKEVRERPVWPNGKLDDAVAMLSRLRGRFEGLESKHEAIENRIGDLEMLSEGGNREHEALRRQIADLGRRVRALEMAQNEPIP